MLLRSPRDADTAIRSTGNAFTDAITSDGSICNSLRVRDSQPMATRLFQSLLFRSGTVFRSTSHPRRHFPSSALAWRHTSSNCVTHKLLSCLRNDIVILDTL